MKISVSISAYNAEATIARTIESVLSQTYQNFEMIIVNDGSTDATLKIAEQYRLEHPDKIVIKSIENGGLANARNTALPLCTGDLYINLDSDDYIENDTFERAIECFNLDGDVDVCFYGYKSFDENGRFFDYYLETKQYPDRLLDGIEAFQNRIMRKIWICQGNAIYRLSMIRENNITNHKGKNQGEDMYFISRCLLAARKVAHFKGDNFCCMTRSDSMNHAKFNESFFQTVELLDLLIGDIKRDYPDKLDLILPYLYAEKSTQTISIIKRMASYFKFGEYKRRAAELQKNLKLIDKGMILPIISKQKRLEFVICRLSLTAFYFVVAIYYKLGK